MKCFTAQQSPYCCVGIGSAVADPETISRSPIADQSTDSNEVSLAAAVRLRVAGEEMSGAEMVHTPKIRRACLDIRLVAGLAAPHGL